MHTSLKSFCFALIGILLFVFGIHTLALYVRSLPHFNEYLVLSYVLNFVLTCIVYFMVLRANKTQSAQAGFVFVIGSAIKFAVFLLVLKPLFKADGEISGVELTSFFVPYVCCLVFEVYALSKQLNRQ